MTIVLPWPPSVNGYYRSINGRNILSRKGRTYRTDVQKAVIAQAAAKHLNCRLHLDIVLHPPDKRRRDIDNSLKALLDAMQKAGVFLDDSQVDLIRLERGSVEKGGCAVVEIIKKQEGKCTK